MDPRRAVSPESALASDIFDKFCSANTLKAILSHYRHLCCTLRLKPTHFPDFYPRLTTKLSSWRAQGLWTKFEKRASHKCYNGGKACYGNRVLIIGAGPCGLRTAIEAQLLGAKVVVIEKRDRFSRNNVLHLWPFVIADLKALGAKKFYGKFCAGSIDHISIRQLQCILLKVALLLGVEVLEGVGFEGLCEPAVNEGWRANVSPADHPVSHYDFDVLIGADGRRNTLEGFKRKALRAKLAIAITANFINKHTEAEARVKEISGVSYIFNQKFFQQLNEATGIDLENIVYYKDETHYFVMTAKKQSLLNKGVLLQDHSDTTKLLSHDNISSEALMIYALEAAIFSTDNQLLNLEFAVNHYGQPDVAMFDFTAMYAAENACRVVQRKGHKLLMSLVGDSLLEPFWPTGSGCARGFLSSFDACWMLRSWASGGKSILEVIAERESIYRLLGQTTPENLNKEHVGYAIDPYSRYPNLNVRVVLPFQVKSLLESDETDNVDFVGGVCKGHLLDAEKVLKKRRRDCVIAVDSLLSWVRDQVTCYGLEVIDVCDAFIRGDALCAIISRFRPDLIDFPLPSEENVDPLNTAASRNQIAFDLLHEEHGLSPIMSGFDSVQCTSSDFLTIVAYLSQIYEVFRGEIPQINYPRMENNEDIDDLDPQRYNHCGPKQHSSRPPLAARHFSGKFLNRRSRVSSSGRDGRIDGDNESSRKCKKRRGDDRSRGTTGREIKTSASHIVTNKQHVTGLTNKLEEKLKGSKLMEKKPKDLVKAIGKIEKVHWNVQFTDKKITESKTRCLNKKERDDKVPKWSREAFNNKREAMQRKIEGCGSENGNHKLQQFQDQVKDLGIKLKEGNSREVGQRGSNKVSQMASQLVHKLEMPLNDHTVTKTSVQRSLFEFPNKGGSESCHFCDERVYVVERMTAEGKFFHRNCFRCEYCNTSLRLGNYVFDREGRYGERFYCTPHYGMVRLYGWKKYDLGGITTKAKFVRDRVSLLTPANLQILTVIDERGTTPERVEFENSVDFASEEELLSEMDEDEWTDRNFGVLNVGNNTSDEASDLSDDEDDITPEGNLPCKPSHCEDAVLANSKADNSDSDTEIASEDESGGNTSTNEEEDCEGEEEEGVEEGEDDCEGSTTEIDTDSEFADDPPYSVPGSIPTIVVDEPEQQVTRIIERTPLGHTHPRQTTKEIGHHCKLDAKPPQVLQPQIRQYRMDEPVKQTFSDRLLPRVNLVPKKWEPLPSLHDYQLASKLSLELKQKYLHGTLSNVTLEKKNVMDSAAQNQFRSVLDMISEKQKLLQPAAKPSATMQAFLDGAEKLKTKQKLSPISGAVCFTNSIENCSMNSLSSFRSCNIVNDQSWAQNNTVSKNDAGSLIEKNLKQNGGFSNMNRVNIEKNLELMGKNWNEDPEKCDFEKEILRKPIQGVPNVICTDRKNEAMPDSARIVVVPSDLLSFSHSEATDTPSTITGAHKNGTNKVIYPQTDQEKVKVQNQKEIKSNAVEDLDSESEEEGSGTESVHHLSESDDVDIEVDCIYATQKPPRVEIKDEFGVTFKVHECYDQNTETSINKTFCSSATSNEYLLENKDSNSIEISSSDSKDSLNSGVFLETEMSDWTRDGGGRGEQPQEGIKNKKKQNEVNKQSTSYIRHQHENDNSKKYSKLKASLTLELETIDFMDKDGESSPDDVAPQKKQGHCKLSNENVELEYRVNVSHYCYLLNNPCDKHFSGISSRESATTVGFQKSISEKAGSLTPKAIRQDNTVFASKAEQDFEKAVNPIMEKPIKSEQRPSFSSASPLGNNKYAILDRVVPFSNARDSLDNRKMKSIVSGSVNCKEILFPPYQACESIPRTVSICSSVISTNTNHTATADRQFDLENHNVLNSVLKNAVESTNIKTLDASNISHDGSDNQFYHRPLQLARAKSNSSYTDKSSNSPHIVRRIEEINNERTKQSDLIRSMVIGRLLKSPEKNRRNSKGSLSHLCAFNSSGSGSSEHFVPPSSAYQGEATESISCRNCQHSVISNLSAQDNNPAKNKNLVINRGLDCLKDPKKRDSADNVGLACLSSYWKGSESSRQEIELETQLKLKLSHASAQYEPVFTSSRFRNCPKFNSSLSIYSAVTNPPISVSPSPNILFRSTSDVFFSTKSFESRNRNKLPSFHRSMPDLSTFVKPSNVRSATSYTKEWEAYKSALIVDQKKVRQAARECARLKSDEDLRLSETDCTNKEKLRRKMSVPGDDVFDPNAAVVVSNVLSPAIPASCSDSSTSTKIIFENTRPISDMFDNVASSIRHNVDFPITKSIPFLAFPCHRSVAGSGSDAPLTGDLWLSETYDNKKRLLGLREIIKNDDFVHLRLRFNPKQNSPERIVSTDSARNVGQDKISELFPYYFKQASSDPLSFSSPQSNANSRIFKQEPKESRSNTPCDSYIRFSENHAGYSSSVNSLRASTSISPTAHNSTKSTVTKASPGPPKPKPSKYKAFSSVILVDEPHDLTPFGEAAGGTGVPNLIKDPCSENNQKNPKDRERLRSIIQAVSDFFSSRSLKNESSTNNSFSSTPNINQTAGTYLLSKEKFSLFKSTPKLLHKDRGVSKSRESLFPTLPASGCESLKDRSKFASYLSHPNKVIKMLSSSPTHLTPSRANLDSGRYSVATTSHSALDVSSAISPSFVTRRDSLVSTSQKSSRLQEVQAARLQLESIEVELTKLKTLRTSIQENLKSKESDNENREDAEFVEEEATLVKEKKPLARLESDLVLKAQQLQIEELKGHAQENLDNENSCSIQNMKDLKMREILVITELHSLEKLKGNLLSKYKDIQNYKAEVAKLESKIASCCVSPQESNV